MAGQGNLLVRLAELVRPFDDAAWEALANKGLLRRARKDLASGALPVCMEAEEAGGVRLAVGACTVFVPEAGPAKATCSCPTAGVCQHILAAGLFLQGMESGPPAVDDPDAGWLALDIETIRKWVGAAEFRAAVALTLDEEEPAAVESNTGRLTIVRFPVPGVECRLLSGGGLEGIIVSGGNAKQARHFAAAAVLAVRRARGLELPPEVVADVAEGAGSALKASADAPRSRAEVLASVRALLQEAVAIGLVHLGGSTSGRLTTLSISALGVNLPRLALALRNLADEVRLLTTRAARADTGRFLWAMARTNALAEALTGPAADRADLVGAYRSQYEETDALELTGVCAYPWRAASGYQGLTVLFWDTRRQEWASWSDARPEGQPGGFDPRARYGAEVSWQGGMTPHQLSLNRVLLRHARRNRAGRLSSSSRCIAAVLGPTDNGQIPFGARLFTRWETLRTHAADSLPVGLHEPPGSRDFVVVQPARWRQRDFDSVSQVFRWWVEDDAGEPLALELPFDAWTWQAVETLEHLPSPSDGDRSPWQIVGRLHRQRGEISLYPLTLLNFRGSMLHLHLDTAAGARPAAMADPATAPQSGETRESEWGQESDGSDDADENLDSPLLDGTIFDRTLMPLEARLDALAESGTETSASIADRVWFEQQYARLTTFGLGALGRSAGRVGTASGGKAIAAEVLRCRYFCSVFRQAASKTATDRTALRT